MTDPFDESEYGWAEGGASAEDVESATRSCLAIFVILALIAVFLAIVFLAAWLM